MRISSLLCAITVVCLGATSVAATEEDANQVVHGLIDLRALQTDDQSNWFDLGLGKTRYGGKRGDGARRTVALGEASLILRPHTDWGLSGHLHLRHESEQKSPVDVIEGFATFSPVSTTPWRFSLKVGAFFPPVSLENTDVAWQSPYTITWSAMNSWVGEDIRAAGAELSSRYRYDRGQLSFGGAVFLGGDSSGTILNDRGWAMHDRATGLFDRLPKPANSSTFQPRGDIAPFKELDDSPGVYLFARGEDDAVGGEFLITAFDNLADESASRRKRGAWRTRFVSGGVGYFLPFGVELISQVLIGETERRAPSGVRLDDSFAAAYLMFSGFVDADEEHRWSLRYDRFQVNDRIGAGVRRESGDAWTLAYSFRPDEHHRLSVEILSVDSNRPARQTTGVSADQRDTTLQANYRFAF